ncbi:hypothetical protein CK203_070330 [Vitis vinifera]|uniref:Uncharacterized protein n=1 Tax=Vitis vinifera TaxID=29760 RepID=A0A438E6X4_VITVI|nr:hypothetical protein CK203_070330 [Vitis vinifera]
MSTLSRSQSSVMGGEDYFMWREKMERCQRENDRQMWTLFRQMKQLKEENEELQTQMGHRVILWQLFQTVQEGVFAGSPYAVGRRNNIYPSI